MGGWGSEREDYDGPGFFFSSINTGIIPFSGLGFFLLILSRRNLIPSIEGRDSQ